MFRHLVSPTPNRRTAQLLAAVAVAAMVAVSVARASGPAPADSGSDEIEVIPAERGVGLAAADVRTFNEAVQGRLETVPRVSVVDLESQFDAQTFTVDGVHPTAAGSAEMARRWSSALLASDVAADSGRELSILPLGDSITAASYRHDLWRELVEAGVEADFVGSRSTPPSGFVASDDPTVDLDHLGIEGARVADVRSALDDVASDRVDVVLLHVGTNDLFFSDQPPAVIAAEVEELVEDILDRFPQARVLVARIIPFLDDARVFFRALAENG